MKIFALFGTALAGSMLLPWLLAGQPRVAVPRFEAASIKAAIDAPSPFGGRMGFMRQVMGATDPPGTIRMPDPGRVTLRKISLLSLAAMAYRTPRIQVSGPAWMDSVLFDVDAKVPPGTPKGQVNEMLQSFLVERFGLVAHLEQKEISGYALSVGKRGPRLKPAARFQPTSGGDEAEVEAALRKSLASGAASASPLPAGLKRYTFQGVDAGQLAAILSRLTLAPVVDVTRLTDTYDIALDVSVDETRQLDSIFDAVENLGLKLDRRRVPTNILLVDKVSKAPTPN